LLWNKDWSLARIAEALLIYKKCIKRYIDEYLDKDRLKPINGGSDSYLNDEKTQRPIQHLCDVTYLHQHQIITDIKMTFDISDYSIPSINKWLHKTVSVIKNLKVFLINLMKRNKLTLLNIIMC
jgi:hypothetical protein